MIPIWKGKTYEEVFGKDKSKEWRDNISKSHMNKISSYNGKTYNQIYGNKKAEKIKEKISLKLKGHKGWNKGKKLSEETKQKISIAKKGKSFEELYGHKKAQILKKNLSRINKGKKLSEITRQKIGGHSKGNTWNIGRKFSIERRKKMSESIKKSYTEERKKRLSELNSGKNHPQYGKHRSKETKQKLSKAMEGKFIGDKNPAWKGGKSFEPYGIDFNNRLKKIIKERDGKCMLCNISINDLKLIKRQVHIHHIDYNKSNTFPQNLITLCVNCHSLTHNNREKWRVFFHKLLYEQYDYKYTQDQKIILDFTSR